MNSIPPLIYYPAPDFRTDWRLRKRNVIENYKIKKNILGLSKCESIPKIVLKILLVIIFMAESQQENHELSQDKCPKEFYRSVHISCPAKACNCIFSESVPTLVAEVAIVGYTYIFLTLRVIVLFNI